MTQAETDLRAAPVPTAPVMQSALEALLAADRPDAVRAALEAAYPQAPTLLAIWHQWPDAGQALPANAAEPATMGLARLAIESGRAGTPAPAGTRVMCDDGDGAAVLLGDSVDALPADLAAVAGRRICELLTAERLRGSVAQLADAEQLQHALFAIADMAGSERDMPALLRGLHGIVGALMYAENFYIALFNHERQTVRFIYFADEFNKEDYSPDEEVPIAKLEGGLTWYVLHDCKPLMGSLAHIREQVSGPLRARGADAVDWLGVPMLRDGKAVGALVVQSYRAGVQQYTDSARAVLSFVAEHVLNAVARKQTQEDLERRVEERTRELAAANVDLQQEVRERERAEHLQATLYRIAALATGDDDSERFYSQIHQAVGELINAENFYIALLDDTGTQLQFPYSVDDRDVGRKPRPLGRGLTEYVIRHGETLLVDTRMFDALQASGDIDLRVAGTTPAMSWLGVPLIVDEGVIGVVAVQSYRGEIVYDQGDAELLNFVSSQIANSLQRRRNAEALRALNASLEARVTERTRELSEQIAVREQVEEQLKHQVMHDPLTGLPNRLYLRDRLERALSGLKRYPSRRFSLLYLDVDRFKLFNDSLGHLAGDAVLKEVARRLAGCVREPDVVARLSGDEFAILLEETPVPQAATRVAERIQASLSQPMQILDRELQTSASIGIAIGETHYPHIDALLHDADVALYRAKSAGRARFVLFDDSLQRAALDVLGLEHELRAALARDEFEPFFQPLVRLVDGAIVGYEALIRWHHPSRGVLAPGDFLSVAEESGLIEAIDWRMYHLACAEAAPLLRNGGFLTLNISPRHFQNDDFDERLLALTRTTGFNPAQLRIEVTEGTLLGDPDAVARILARLRDACIEAALDDFGTGYSSLGYVHRFPLKMIKIDRSFVDPLGSDRAQRSSVIINAILALSHSLGLEVVAEGIETLAQSTQLQAMGCVYGQGYHFGRPQPASHWLESPASDG